MPNIQRCEICDILFNYTRPQSGCLCNDCYFSVQEATIPSDPHGDEGEAPLVTHVPYSDDDITMVMHSLLDEYYFSLDKEEE